MSIIQLATSPTLRKIVHFPEVFLSPIVSGSLLFGFLNVSEDTRLAILRNLRLPASIDVRVVQIALQVLLGVGVLGSINSSLSRMAMNSWRLTRASGWDWPKEIAVITGGCSGIGYCTVERLIKRGVRVAILDIQDLPKAFASNPLIRFYKCDITSPEAVANAADAIRKDFGHPTILINNAGITKPYTVLDMPKEVLLKIFEVNCFSHWTMVQEFMPRMIQLDKGHIVTLASLAGYIAIPKGADYCASKSAAVAFHETLGTELRQFHKSSNILTSVVNPNFVRTPFLDPVKGIKDIPISMLTPDQVAERITAQIFSRTGGEVVVPKEMGYVMGIRAWPTWVQIVIRDAMGKVAAGMKN